MNNEIQLVSDSGGFAVIGNATDVERFLFDQGLDRIPSKDLDRRRLGSVLGTGGAAAKVSSELAENSGRWVKLTKQSAEAVKKRGLMPTKTPGVSHAMIGVRPGHSKQWLRIAQAPGALLSGPMALSVLSIMMQQQMDEIVEYLQEINEKVDDILRSQKNAVLADMIGAELIIEEASGRQTSEAKRRGQAATEVRDKVLTTTTEGVDTARRFGAKTFDQAAEALRAVGSLLQRKRDTAA